MNNQNQFYKLLMGCPFGNPTKECVIERYRKMSILDLMDNYRVMERNEINVLFGEHTECIKYRTDQKIAS
jgi:hypothetical protein